MRIVSKISTSLFALALLVGFSAPAMAADAKADAKGTIKGTVTGEDGKPAANTEVKVLPPMGAKKDGAKPAEPKAAVKPLAAGEKKGGPTPVATATTNDKGEFSVEVPAGDYTVAAGGGKGMAMGREKVTVKAGETATVSITLKARKAK